MDKQIFLYLFSLGMALGFELDARNMLLANTVKDQEHYSKILIVKIINMPYSNFLERGFARINMSDFYLIQKQLTELL